MLLARNELRRLQILQLAGVNDLELPLLVDPHRALIEEVLEHCCCFLVLSGPVLRLDQVALHYPQTG